MYENQPTLFNTCILGRISVHVGGAVGVGYGFRVVEGVDSVDSYSDCINMQLLCLREREKFCSLTIYLRFSVSE